jgi:hypothetical protein
LTALEGEVMTIAVGDIVTVAQTGDVYWTVVTQLPGGLWRLTRDPDVVFDVDEAEITVVFPITVEPLVIGAGAMVTCRQTGLVLYVVCGIADDGIRWRLRGKRDDARGRSRGRRRRSHPNPPDTHLLIVRSMTR